MKVFNTILSNLVEENIKLVSVDRRPYSINNERSYFFDAALNEEVRRSGTVAFTPSDDSKKMYLSIDKLYFIDPMHPDSSLRRPPAVDITDTLIHEASHFDRRAVDLFYLGRDADGKMLPILDEVEKFLNNIGSSTPRVINMLSKINKQYISDVGVYRTWKDTIINSEDTFLYFSSCETGILANYYIYNADFLTKIVRDIYQNSFVDRPRLTLLEMFSRALHLG